MVDADISLDHVIEIDVEDEEIVGRLSGRRVHPGSGRVYHVQHNPQASDGVDDISGEPLIQRDDDREETVRKRLAVYHEQTQPLVDFYKTLDGPVYHSVKGVGTVEDISKHIKKLLD